VKERKSTEPDLNLVSVKTKDFVQYYNENVPDTFPRASIYTLEKFQDTYPGLFGKDKEWTIDKHRKKLMDWLSSHSEDK
jgi:hypothetical protein